MSALCQKRTFVRLAAALNILCPVTHRSVSFGHQRGDVHVAADPNKVYRLKTDGEAVLISDADTLDAFARWSGWDGVEQFLEGMKMNANDLLNHWFYVTGGTCHLCDPESEAFELMLKNVDGQWQKDRG
jgi:hypothetical protein